MINKVVEQLKTGRVKTVVAYGQKAACTPYVVVKEEPAPEGRRMRCIAHFERGQQVFLDDFVRDDMLALLDGVQLTSRYGATNILSVETEPSGLVVDNDDGTISRERCFLLPSKIF